MKGFSRSFTYFTVLALQYTAALLVILAAVLALKLLTEASGSSLSTQSLPVLGLTGTAVFIPAFSAGHYLLMPTLTVSFSCTRRNLFWGCQWMYALMLVLTLLAISILFQFFPYFRGGMTLRLLPAVTGLLAASVGFGQLIGGMVSRLGKAGLVIMTITSGLLGAVGGFCASFLSDKARLPFLQAVGDSVLCLIIGLAMLAAGVCGNYFFLRNLSVR